MSRGKTLKNERDSQPCRLSNRTDRLYPYYEVVLVSIWRTRFWLYSQALNYRFIPKQYWMNMHNVTSELTQNAIVSQKKFKNIKNKILLIFFILFTGPAFTTRTHFPSDQIKNLVVVVVVVIATTKTTIIRNQKDQNFCTKASKCKYNIPLGYQKSKSHRKTPKKSHTNNTKKIQRKPKFSIFLL